MFIILYFLTPVSKEEDSFYSESHPRVGLVCHGAYSSRRDGNRVCGGTHPTGNTALIENILAKKEIKFLLLA